MKKLLVFIVAIFALTPAFSQKPNPGIENVIVVFKTHFDIGYTDLAGSVVHKYQTSMIDGALKVIDRTKSLPADQHFTWTLPAWPMQQILSGCSPETKEKVVDALKSKYLAVHALPFTMETEASDLETLARAFQSSSDISNQYGLELPRDAKMTDVPEHSWILATVLANAGVKFLHLGCNSASQSPEVPDLFWWEGPDGSRVLTMYSWKYYGTDVVPPEGWPYKTWIAIIHTNDNTGAPEPEVVQQTLDEIKKLNPNARVTQGRMSDFYDLIMKENAQIPVVKKDMPDTWIHGYMSMPEEVKISRAMKREIFTLDKLNTELNFWKSSKSDVSPIVKKAVENSLLFDEHTFGLAMSHGHSGYWCYGDQFRTLKTENVFDPIEFSWKEKGLRITDAELAVQPALNDKLMELATSINIREDHVTVYNPLPWARDGVVILQVRTEVFKNANALKDAVTGEVTDMAVGGNVARFIARGVPGMGYKTYIPLEIIDSRTDLLADRQKNTIENGYFRITVDPARGGLGSVVDKQSGKEMVKQGSEYVFGGYMYERFSKENTESYAKDYIKGGWDWAPSEIGRPNLTDDKYKQIHPVPYNVQYETDNVKVSAILQFRKDANNPHDYTMIYSLYKGLPYIEVQWGIIGKSPEPWPEAGWISFPFKVDNPQFRVGRLGSIVDPSKDYIKNSNLDYCFVNTGVAVTGKENKGFVVSSPDVPGVSLDRPGLWKFSRNFTPSAPNVFYNLYNNQWSTNFTEWIEGSWSARFYIWGTANFDNEKSLITPSEEQRVPMLADFAPGTNGSLPLSAEGLSLSMKGVLVTAFGKNPYGDGLVLRLWEQAGNTGNCTVTLPEGLNGKVAIPVNLRGEATGSPFTIQNNSVSIDVKPYKPYSFVII
jgi:alpha-mannosidase